MSERGRTTEPAAGGAAIHRRRAHLPQLVLDLLELVLLAGELPDERSDRRRLAAQGREGGVGLLGCCFGWGGEEGVRVGWEGSQAVICVRGPLAAPHQLDLGLARGRGRGGAEGACLLWLLEGWGGGGGEGGRVRRRGGEREGVVRLSLLPSRTAAGPAWRAARAASRPAARASIVVVWGFPLG